MSKHTPGPWVEAGYGDYNDYDGNCRVILGEGGDIRTAIVLGFDNDRNRANARLIAAAPDLLAALKGLSEAYCRAGSALSRDERHEDRMRLIAARAAIDKANVADK